MPDSLRGLQHKAPCLLRYGAFRQNHVARSQQFPPLQRSCGNQHALPDLQAYRHEDFPGLRAIKKDEMENSGVFCWPSIPKQGTAEYERFQRVRQRLCCFRVWHDYN